MQRFQNPFHNPFQPLPRRLDLNAQRDTGYSNELQTQPSSLQAPSASDTAPPHGYRHLENKHRLATSGSCTSSRVFRTIGFLGHLVLALVPIAFIVLAFLALSVDGEPVSHRGETVLEAARLGPTVFPIVFAAVVGHLMKNFALWRAERGSKLGLLEQLNGSQNLLAALERSLLLPGVWGWSIAILVLWALSPLGGQSSLRILELTSARNGFDQELYYFDTDNDTSTIFLGASAIDSGLPAVQAIYQACLLAPASVQSSTVDTWGNVKIPLMQAQPGYTGSPSQEWIDVDHNNSTIYSSLTGIIISGLRPSATANFTLETSYINLTCPDVKLFGNGSPNLNMSDVIVSEFQEWLGAVAVYTNKSRIPFMNPSGDDPSMRWNSFMVDSNLNISDMARNVGKPVNLIYASQDVTRPQIAAYNCSVGSSHVESMVGCNGTVCQVDRMRPSRIFTNSSVQTPWNRIDSSVRFSTVLLEFPFLAGTVHFTQVNPADYYVNGNDTPFLPAGLSRTNYSDVTGMQVSHRLGTLLNTMWQSGIAQSSIARPPPADYTATNPNYPFIARSVNSTMWTAEVVYHANRLWVGLTATISLILFACGVAGLAFRYMTKTPDILGYVSTMTRDNPYFDDPRTGGADNLDGLERARLLSDAMVQITDVRPWQLGGHIALKSVDAEENHKPVRLHRGQISPTLSLFGTHVH